jgi:hypothetical protein
MDILINDAYEEACRKLGEQVVLNGLLEAEVERLRAEVQGGPLTDSPAAPVQTLPVRGDLPPSGRDAP